MPGFAHLPLLLKPDGNGKLSKRDGDRLGFPVFPLRWTDPSSGEVSSGYRESGYFPEAFINMLAFLGWNPGTEQEIFTMEELIEAFGIDRISKSGAKYDQEKAKWYNQQYLRLKTNEEIAHLFMPVLTTRVVNTTPEYVIKVIGLVKERISFISEIWDQSSYFFVAPEKYDEQVIKKRWREETPAIMKEITGVLERINPFDKQIAHDTVMQYIEKNNLGTGAVMNSLRLCIVGAAVGPDLFEIINMIGKNESIRRIEVALEKIQ